MKYDLHGYESTGTVCAKNNNAQTVPGDSEAILRTAGAANPLTAVAGRELSLVCRIFSLQEKRSCDILIMVGFESPYILNGNGVFAKAGEELFDDYWANFGKIEILVDGKRKKLSSFEEYLRYRGLPLTLNNPKAAKRKVR